MRARQAGRGAPPLARRGSIAAGTGGGGREGRWLWPPPRWMGSGGSPACQGRPAGSGPTSCSAAAACPAARLLCAPVSAQRTASVPNERPFPRMDYISEASLVPCGQDKYISKNELLLHLKTYNLYYEGQNLQLRHREEEGEFIVEGLLNISWGLRRPIRLQMQDDNQRIRPPPSSSSWHSGCNLGAHGSVVKPTTLPDIQVTDAEPSSDADATDGGIDDRDLKAQQEDVPQLMRTRSDVGVRRRGNLRTPSEQRRIKRHRFSINGHFYNHKTSVFTPAYGSVTNVRINSTMTTPQVLKLLLNKFKIENSAEEFALYIVHTSGEKQKLKATDYPLIARILQGPCEQVSKVFLMEKDQVEEVTYDVAQYIKFEMPVLKSFIQKLKEEEDREVKKLKRKYSVLRVMIEQRLEEISEGPATM